MAILENCKLFYARLDPKSPNATFNKDNPTWEVQIRTSDVAQMKEWTDLGLEPKLIKYKDDHEDAEKAGMPMLDSEGKKQWRVNLQKRKFKTKEGKVTEELNKPVEVVDGDLNPIDPRTIANESIGNVHIITRDHSTKEGKVIATLMGVQISHLVEYTPTDYVQEGFAKSAKPTTVTKAQAATADSEEASDEDDAPTFAKAPSAPGKTVAPPEDVY